MFNKVVHLCWFSFTIIPLFICSLHLLICLSYLFLIWICTSYSGDSIWISHHNSLLFLNISLLPQWINYYTLWRYKRSHVLCRFEAIILVNGLNLLLGSELLSCAYLCSRKLGWWLLESGSYKGGSFRFSLGSWWIINYCVITVWK